MHPNELCLNCHAELTRKDISADKRRCKKNGRPVPEGYVCRLPECQQFRKDLTHEKQEIVSADSSPFWDVGTRHDEYGIREEKTRIDFLRPISFDEGPTRPEKSDAEIAIEVRGKVEPGEPCSTHNAPGCNVCLATIRTLQRERDSQIIRAWLFNPQTKYAVCTSNVLKILDALGQHDGTPIPGGLLEVAKNLDLKMGKGQKEIIPELPIEKNLILADRPYTSLYKNPTSLQKGKRGRPHKVTPLPEMRFRKRVGLTVRQVAEFLNRPDFNPVIPTHNLDAICPGSTIFDSKLRDCYIHVSLGKIGRYKGLSVGSMIQFNSLLPMREENAFTDDDLTLYRRYAANNYNAEKIVPWGKISALEERIIRRLIEMRLVRLQPFTFEEREAIKQYEKQNRKEHANDLESDLERDQIDEVDWMSHTVSQSVGENGYAHKLNSFEIGQTTKFRRSGDGMSESDAPDYGQNEDDREPE